MVGFAGRPWREEHGANGSALSDLPFQLVWETSRKQAGKPGILTNFTGGRHGLEIATGTAGEQAEKLEQLRALERGRSIYVLKVDRATHGIDTPEQYAAFVERRRKP